MDINHALRLIIPALFLFFSCKNEQNNDKQTPIKTSGISYFESYPKYAKGFDIKYQGTYKHIRVFNPWDSTKILSEYLLYPQGTQKPSYSGSVTYIEIPVKATAAIFTTHISFLEKIEMLSSVVAISEPEYIKNRYIQNKLTQNKIINIGASHNINKEKLIAAQPDILIVSPFKDNKYEGIKNVGIPLVISSSYMESNPIGRTEWIKFISYFFNKEKIADSIISVISDKYESLKKIARAAKKQPTVFSNKKTGDIWFMPGGGSYMAQFYKNAGANYLWANTHNTGSIPLDFETVVSRAASADYWCFIENFTGEYTRAILGNENKIYKSFNSYKKKKVIVCNSKIKPYYEQGLFEPDIILSDLINIFHPGILTDYKNKYFELIP